MISPMRGVHLVREARKRAGLTQADVAARAGTTQSAVARVESGTVSPSLERLTELVRACGFDIDVRLVPSDDHEWSMVLRNRTLDPELRMKNMLAVEEFARMGREAMAAARAERRSGTPDGR